MFMITITQYLSVHQLSKWQLNHPPNTNKVSIKGISYSITKHSNLIPLQIAEIAPFSANNNGGEGFEQRQAHSNQVQSHF